MYCNMQVLILCTFVPFYVAPPHIFCSSATADSVSVWLSKQLKNGPHCPRASEAANSGKCRRSEDSELMPIQEAADKMKRDVSNTAAWALMSTKQQTWQSKGPTSMSLCESVRPCCVIEGGAPEGEWGGWRRSRPLFLHLFAA